MTQQASSNKPSDAELKQKLTKMQYDVTQKDGTEPPFRNAYWDNHAPGIYVDVISGEPLFASVHKFDSGTGWPSFFDPLDRAHIRFVRGTSYGMIRTEIRCARCEGHLGHVFDDGPPPTGERYCMNSVSLQFVPEDQPLPDRLGRSAPEGKPLS